MSATTRNQVFTAVHTVGALLPADMLVRISEGKDVPGSKPADYGLPSSRSVRDEAERSWEYLKPLWRELRTRLPEDAASGAASADPTGLAATEWLTPLWRELGYGPLTPLGGTGVAADSDADKTFPVSHRWQHVLIHQTPWNADLDKRPGGAGTVPPQSMLQECLNRTEAHLWGTLTNGRQLRLLRDSSALATASYVEFDLEAIFDGELFSEFVLLYRLLHVSRFEVAEDAAPSACRLEKWRTEAIASGTRALDQLRKGVQRAITTLGTGFLRHPDNRDLRENLNADTFHQALLRLVYRLLFLFVAEDRGVLLSPSAPDEAKDRYARYFSTARLRRHAHRRRGTAHGDLYQALRFVLTGLGNDDGRPELGLPGLGGLFDDTETDALLHRLTLANEPLLEAVRALSIVRDPSTKRNRAVDYRHLDAEELGSIYESLLELVPKHHATDRTFALVELAGNARKTTGSYYTPSSLIECLLDSTLDPVIDDAVKRGELRASHSGRPDPSQDIETKLLNLTVCDPACGSGHFLVAAARRIAKRLAAVREQNPEPTIDAVRHALHQVVARCIYGVDINPMAVELAKVSLWMEAIEPGKPLGFLDAHIKHGNSLLGATPALLAQGIPDDAFKPIEGDDKKIASALKKRNARERGGQLSFSTEERIWISNAAFAAGMRDITETHVDELRDVRLQSSKFRELEQDAEYLQALHVADAWCAAFMWPKVEGAPTPVTEGLFRDLWSGDAGIPVATNDEIVRLRSQYRFFHWHLEFPEVFRVSETETDDGEPTAGWSGGFSCVLGNPPWETLEFKEREFFAALSAEIANATGNPRKKKISQLLEESPDMKEKYHTAQQEVARYRHYISTSGSFPLCAHGKLKTDPLFAERARLLCGPSSRFGVIVPTGIATASMTQRFFQGLIRERSLVSLLSFRNSGFFPDVAGAQEDRACLLSACSYPNPSPAIFAFNCNTVEEMTDPTRQFRLTPDEIRSLNPATMTCPVFHSRRDADITLSIYRRVPPLQAQGTGVEEWEIDFAQGLFNMTTDSSLFEERQRLAGADWKLSGNRFSREGHYMLPLYEGKMLHLFNHRFGDYRNVTVIPGKEVRAIPTPSIVELDDPNFSSLPRYWVAKSNVDQELVRKNWRRDWLLGWRDVTNPANERTSISTLLPKAAVGHKFPLMFPRCDVRLTVSLAVTLSSFVFDYVSRQKLSGTSMALFVWKQLPVPSPTSLAGHTYFIAPRALELWYADWEMSALARDLDDLGGPFRWNDDRRLSIRAELDALFFHLYGISREDADYILDTFPIVRHKDEEKYGSYRTKELILTEYDRMAAAGVNLENPLVDGENYTSTLTPPPGNGPRHPARPQAG